MFLLLPQAAQPQTADPSAASSPSWEVLEERPAEGEQCLVCRVRIHEGDIVELRYKGRRFFVAASMLADFEANPEHYFEVMEARGVLFDEAATDAPAMKTGWLFFGFYVLTGLIFGAASSYAALNRGQPALGWFFAGLFVNVAALAWVLASRPLGQELHQAAPGLTKIPATSSPRECPGCGNTNHPSALACSSCGQELEPTVESEAARARSSI